MITGAGPSEILDAGTVVVAVAVSVLETSGDSKQLNRNLK